MKNPRTHWPIQLIMMVLPALSILNLPKAFAKSEPDAIVAVDLLTVKEPRSEAESRLRVIRLTTRGGSTGYGDYLDFGLPAKEEEETLERRRARVRGCWRCPPRESARGRARGVGGGGVLAVAAARWRLSLGLGAYIGISFGGTIRTIEIGILPLRFRWRSGCSCRSC